LEPASLLDSPFEPARRQDMASGDAEPLDRRPDGVAEARCRVAQDAFQEPGDLDRIGPRALRLFHRPEGQFAALAIRRRPGGGGAPSRIGETGAEGARLDEDDADAKWRYLEAQRLAPTLERELACTVVGLERQSDEPHQGADVDEQPLPTLPHARKDGE